MDNPEILQPREVVKGTKKGPYATRHTLGWALNGPVKGVDKSPRCFRTQKVCEEENLLGRCSETFDGGLMSQGESIDNSRSNEKTKMKFVESNSIVADDWLKI